MISVAMIVPTWHYFNDPFKLQPLNELYLATVLDDQFRDRVEVSLIDLRELRRKKITFNSANVGALIPQKSLYLYWINKSADFLEMASVVSLLRKLYPASLHAAGGTHVQVFPKESSEVFDTVVLGAGEEAFAQLIRDLEDNRAGKRYVQEWKDADYSRYPHARRGFLPENAVVNTTLFEKYGGIRGTSAMFSRGCNFQCAYCVYNIPHTIQRRTPEQVASEIQYLKQEYGVTGINLRDEICVPLAPRVAIPYLEAIGRMDVIWRGQTRVGTPRQLLTLAKQSGCVELALGVESVSQQVLDLVNKHQRVEEARQSIAHCRELDIKVKMCLIFGLPGEPADILEQTLRFIEEAQPDYVNVSGFCPVPGSPIFYDQARFGIKEIDSDWNRHAHLMMRFSNEEHFGLPFRYEDKTPWGTSFSNGAIMQNIKTVQVFLRENGRCY
jgi:radical SAM superfamily enzyme YgiQ (UPF0313 family)